MTRVSITILHQTVSILSVFVWRKYSIKIVSDTILQIIQCLNDLFGYVVI